MDLGKHLEIRSNVESKQWSLFTNQCKHKSHVVRGYSRSRYELGNKCVIMTHCCLRSFCCCCLIDRSQLQELIHCDESLSCESVTMPAENTEGENDMNAMKAMVNSLAQSVQTLTSRVAAPSDQLKKSEELTTTLEYQQRCLKRERECAPKQQGIVKQQNLLDELQTRVKAIAAKVETAPVVVLDDPLADVTKPVKVKRGLLADTDEGKAILLALGATDKLLASRNKLLGFDFDFMQQRPVRQRPTQQPPRRPTQRRPTQWRPAQGRPTQGQPRNRRDGDRHGGDGIQRRLTPAAAQRQSVRAKRGVG